MCSGVLYKNLNRAHFFRGLDLLGLECRKGGDNQFGNQTPCPHYKIVKNPLEVLKPSPVCKCLLKWYYVFIRRKILERPWPLTVGISGRLGWWGFFPLRPLFREIVNWCRILLLYRVSRLRSPQFHDGLEEKKRKPVTN